MISQNTILEAREIIKSAEAILITAGAGMGVDSGLPDFRGNEGFWNAYPPIRHLGISFYEMANPVWFEQNPKLAWAFYGHRLNLYRKTTPHDGFSRLLQLVRDKQYNYFIFTSNVDGHFQKAGFFDDKIEECHGSINHFQCRKPCSDAIWDASAIKVIVDETKFEALEPLPRCAKCGSIARPNVLMFGDWLWNGERTQQQSEQFSEWFDQVISNKQKLVIIEAGAGTAVATVRHLSERIASSSNTTLIRINPRDSHVPEGHLSIPLNAAEGIRQITDSVI
jgi:NAD-dependent SIR2 family protein deacetylase